VEDFQPIAIAEGWKALVSDVVKLTISFVFFFNAAPDLARLRAANLPLP
jgi:hypothetical protein